MLNYAVLRDGMEHMIPYSRRCGDAVTTEGSLEPHGLWTSLLCQLCNSLCLIMPTLRRGAADRISGHPAITLLN